MERLWNRIESLSVNEAIKKNVFLVIHTIICSLMGLVLWFCIRWIDTVYLLDEQYYEETRHHLIRHVEKRLKTADSIAHKLIRKEKRIQEKPLEELLNDLAGVRLICYDIEQIYWVVLKIHQMGKFEVIKEKDYVLKPKENGYQSFHMIIQMDGQRVELQIRTILMDAWSSLDAILTYKKENMVSDKLKKDI